MNHAINLSVLQQQQPTNMPPLLHLLINMAHAISLQTSFNNMGYDVCKGSVLHHICGDFKAFKMN